MGYLWVLFAILGALCWGSYGPAMHSGQTQLGSALRAFLFVGAAYFMMAVVAPAIYMTVKAEPGQYASKGIIVSLIGGALGALGALFVIFAFKVGGKPAYVMPIVFAFAPIVNAVVTMAMHPPKNAINPLFFVGMVLAAGGAGMVLFFKPA